MKYYFVSIPVKLAIAHDKRKSRFKNLTISLFSLPFEENYLSKILNTFKNNTPGTPMSERQTLEVEAISKI
jgi:hypothetical protein